jgi:hypothetical protein
MKRTGLLCLALLSCGQPEPPAPGVETSGPRPRGPYLGEEEPGEEPRLFSPGFVSTGLDEREPSLAPDGKSLYYWVILPGYTTILVSRLEAGAWTDPEVASFSGRYSDFEPAFSVDGQQLFFCSDRPLPGSDGQTDINIWVVDEGADGWGEPYPLDARINTDRVEFFPSLTRDGTLYFNRASAGSPGSAVYRARLVDGVFSEPERLPDVINAGNRGSNVFVDPDESYLLMPRPGPDGQVALHVSFRGPDGTWTEPTSLGETMHPVGWDEGARVSPDGRFIFFSATHYPTAGGIWGKPEALDRVEELTRSSLRAFHAGPQNGGKDIYWVKSSIIEERRLERAP